MASVPSVTAPFLVLARGVLADGCGGHRRELPVRRLR